MSDYKTPNDKLITNEQALELNTCYKEKQMKVLGAENDDGLCCSTWYSIEDLEGYINYVKEQASEKKIPVDGIRFYFGVYPKDMKDKTKAGKNTLFMCPTQSNKSLSEEKYGETETDSQDVTQIPAMNYGSVGNPPKNDYGK